MKVKHNKQINIFFKNQIDISGTKNTFFYCERFKNFAHNTRKREANFGTNKNELYGDILYVFGNFTLD